MEAIGYARISIEDQSQNSIPGQIAEITSYCQRNSLNLHKVFVDNGQSAFNFQRKEWKEVEKYLKQNRSVKYLVIYAMDRFSRANLAEALQKMDEIQKRTGVKILTVSDPVNLDLEDFGTDLRRIMELMFSNYELKKIRKRTSDGMYQAMVAGRWVNNAPYGYRNARDSEGKPILAIDEDKAYAVRLVFRLYLQGMGLEEIRKHTKSHGLKLAGNSAIRRMLSNPLYAALIQLPKHGHNAPGLIKAIHPPIVSENDYWLTQDRLNSKTRKTQGKTDTFLNGVLHCHCGQLMTTDLSKGRGGKQYRYYVCKVHRRAYSAISLHRKMREILTLLSLPEKNIEGIARRLKILIDQKLENRGGDIMRAKINLKKIEDKIAATQERYLSQPDIQDKVYKKVINELSADRQRVQDMVIELSATGRNYHSIMNDLLPRLIDLNSLFEGWPLHKQQAFLKVCFDNSLSIDGGSYRTGFIFSLFRHNLVELSEKGLLFYEQPGENLGETPRRSPYGSAVETDVLECLTELFRLTG